MIVAQLTDLHIGRPGKLAYELFDTSERLARCVDELSRQRPTPDVVLATGDLVDEGSKAEYLRLRRLLAPLQMPVFFIPGNHDDRDVLRGTFPDHGYLGRAGKPACYCIDDYPLRLIGLDTTVPEQTGGVLEASQISWLDERLGAANARPTLLFMHHPPFKTGIARMDSIGLEPASAEELGAVISRHPQVLLLTCGHVHRGIQVRWHGTVASICPSAAYQYGLNLDGSGLAPAPHEPPAYQLHCWNGVQLATHTIPISVAV